MHPPIVNRIVFKPTEKPKGAFKPIDPHHPSSQHTKRTSDALMGSERQMELSIEFKEYADKVLHGYKPEVLWYLIQRAKAEGII